MKTVVIRQTEAEKIITARKKHLQKAKKVLPYERKKAFKARIQTCKYQEHNDSESDQPVLLSLPHLKGKSTLCAQIALCSFGANR